VNFAPRFPGKSERGGIFSQTTQISDCSNPGRFVRLTSCEKKRADGIPYYAGLIRLFNGEASSVGTHGPAISTGKWYVDDQYDLSVEVMAVSVDHGSVTLRIAPADAAGTLSVRAIAASKLQLTGTFSMKNQVLTHGEESVRGRLISLLGR
jgi:hypothetical protein